MDTDARVPSPTWWSDRWAWRGALAAAPLGALGAILYALATVGFEPGSALLAYLLGAAVAAGIGCLLGGPVGVVVDGVRSRRAGRSRATRASAEAGVELPDGGVYPSEPQRSRERTSA
ncbi:MAG TPA: hypothetical protein VM433_15855 [Mycobacteriales bacterium]|nr:hypothetical protein [Mycobacteriales bacterium]